MNSYCEPEFREQYNALPPEVKRIADRAYRLWASDSGHPSLHFKPVKGRRDWWFVRIGPSYRALCVRQGEDVNWFFIGNHRDYDSLIP